MTKSSTVWRTGLRAFAPASSAFSTRTSWYALYSNASAGPTNRTYSNPVMIGPKTGMYWATTLRNPPMAWTVYAQTATCLRRMRESQIAPPTSRASSSGFSLILS